MTPEPWRPAEQDLREAELHRPGCGCLVCIFVRDSGARLLPFYQPTGEEIIGARVHPRACSCLVCAWVRARVAKTAIDMLGFY